MPMRNGDPVSKMGVQKPGAGEGRALGKLPSGSCGV